MFKDLIILAE